MNIVKDVFLQLELKLLPIVGHSINQQTTPEWITVDVSILLLLSFLGILRVSIYVISRPWVACRFRVAYALHWDTNAKYTQIVNTQSNYKTMCAPQSISKQHWNECVQAFTSGKHYLTVSILLVSIPWPYIEIIHPVNGVLRLLRSLM